MGLLSWLFGGDDSPRPKGFSDRYAGGILTIDSPQSVRVYEMGSTMRYEKIWLNEAPQITIADARWSGNRVILTLNDPYWGGPRVRSYYWFGAFDELRN